jgi:spermidine/putrescine transport system substrate-binding protein
MHKKRLLPIFILLSGTTVIVPLTLTSCSRGGINIANFESYMSKDVIHDLKRDYEIKNSLNFLYYATNEDIETKFKKYYDIAIPSTYEVISLFEKDQLEPID